MSSITNVSTFLAKLEELKSYHNIFFRGHSNKDYVLEPGIYRRDQVKKKSLIEFEDKIYRSIISKAPQDFIGKNTLESLALMQHYEAPTRILDLTENALVALYFACLGNYDCDGEVIVFDIPGDSTCNYDSDRVTILSNIAKCGKEFSYNSGSKKFQEGRISFLESKKVLLKQFEELHSFDIEILSFLLENSKRIIEKYEDDIFKDLFDSNLKKFIEEYEIEKGKLSEIDLKHFKNFYIETIQNHHKDLINEEILKINKTFFGKLLHNIREDKSYFDGIIDPFDVAKVFAVKPKLNNPRIVKQSGAFLIFGIQEEYFFQSKEPKPMAILEKKWILRGDTSERIIICRNSKDRILKELKILGFDQSTLFPEVDKVSHFVKSYFLERLK